MLQSDNLRRQMVHEHRTMRMLEEDLLESCDEFCASVDAAHQGQVRRLFDDFANSVRRHFEFEESGGYLRTVTDRRPHHSQAVARLLAEHRELARRLASIQEQLRAELHEDRAGLERFKADFVRLMSQFDHHEVAERELLMEVFWLEGGVSA